MKKVVPLNIQDLLSPRAIAHWIMGDAYFTLDKTVIFCTESFTENEIEMLIKALEIKFQLVARKQKRISSIGTVGWRMRISKKSIEKLSNLVFPYIIPELLYKIGKDVEN